MTFSDRFWSKVEKIGRRLTPLSLPRLKFMERPIDNQ